MAEAPLPVVFMSVLGGFLPLRRAGFALPVVSADVWDCIWALMAPDVSPDWAHAPPINVARTIATMMWSQPGRPFQEEPTHTAMMLPTVYWPWAPMLNRPARKAKATARPTRISGQVATSVCCRLKEASSEAWPVTQGKM